MNITAKQYAISLFETLKDKSDKEHPAVIKNFAKVLITNNHISKLEEIIMFFNKFWNEYTESIEVEIVSVEKLDKNILKTIQDFILKETGSSNIELTESQDKNILGGIVLRYGDKSLDLSLKNKLNKFKKQLTN